MINIFTEENEQTVHVICKWLEKNQEDYNLIYPDSLDFTLSIGKLEKGFSKGLSWCNIETDLFWYRRGSLNLMSHFAKKKGLNEIHRFKTQLEYETLENYIYGLIEKRRNFGTYGNAELNRLLTFDIAEKNNLQTPNYIVTNLKTDLDKFIETNQKIIVKSLANGIFQFKRNLLYTSFTKLFTANDFRRLPEFFFPTLFMEYIKKDFEIRIFYIKGKFYSCAIMSQSNKKTRLDFRNYDLEYPNRFAPYKIPSEIASKLKKVIRFFKLKTCSIDMIVNTQGEFFFLEINPVGQFGFIGYPCNYYLEKKLAEELINSKKKLIYEGK